MTHYFLTGANGVIGAHLARRLAETGGTIRALRRAGSDLSHVGLPEGRVDWVEGDVTDAPLLYELLEGVDYVVHAAAIVSFSRRKRRQMFRVNVEGTANLVNAALENGVKKLAYVSSVGAVGRPENKTRLDEKEQWTNSALNTQYGYSKFLGECEVWRGVAEGLPAVAVNPAIVLGAGDWTRSSLQLFKYAAENKKYCPTGLINYVDARDVADALVRLLHSEVENERYILSASHLAYREFFEKVCVRLGTEAPRTMVKPWMAALAWRLEWVKSLFAGGEPMITRETARTSASRVTFDGSKIERELGFRYRSLEETIEEAARYFEGRGWLEKP